MDSAVNTIKKGLTSFQIKIIAVVIMTIDHLGAYQFIPMSHQTNDILRSIGRIAAPLFLFMITEGLRHTRSKIKYILRLYIAGAAIQICNEILAHIFSSQGFGMPSFGNIMHTFFYAALYIACLDYSIKIIKEKKEIKKIILPVLTMIIPFGFTCVKWVLASKIFAFLPESILHVTNIFTPSPFGVDYSFLFVLLGITWYFINNKFINCIVFAVFSAICGIVSPMSVFGISFLPPYLFTFYHLFVDIQWMMVFAIPFMLLYNGEKGKHSLKYFFYLYYPLHQYLFMILSVLSLFIINE